MSVRRTAFLVWVGLAALLLPIAGEAQAAEPIFGQTTFTLKNGLQVVVVPNHRAPLVTQWVWYKVGGADEVRGKSGAAHFLEHLMFKGTKTLKPKEFSALIARQGGQENAYTSWDYTAFHQKIAASQLELIMRLEADRMHNLVFDEKELNPERDVVLEEWGLRIGNVPSALLDEQVETSLYLNHPYRIPVLGWTDEIKTLGVADEKRFYDTWYAPNNAVLVIAGDVTVAEVKALAEKYYGSIPSHPVPDRVRVQEPGRSADTVVTLHHPRVRTPSWSRRYLAPSYRAGEKEHAYALEVLAEILGGGANSRLHHALVLDQQISVGAGAFYSPNRFDLSSFGFYATPRPGSTVEDMGKAVDDVVEKLLKDGVTADEVSRAEDRIVTAAQYAEDSLEEPAEIIGRTLSTGQTLDDLNAWPERIKAVTPEQVMAAAKFVLDAKPSVTGLLLPADAAAAARFPAQPEAPPPSGEIR